MDVATHVPNGRKVTVGSTRAAAATAYILDPRLGEVELVWHRIRIGVTPVLWPTWCVVDFLTKR